MAGSRRKNELLSDFWCINCGNKGIPIMRERCKVREKGHRKALYCITCKTIINHIETRNEEEAKQFRQDYESGRFRDEAERSIEYAKRK